MKTQIKRSEKWQSKATVWSHWLDRSIDIQDSINSAYQSTVFLLTFCSWTEAVNCLPDISKQTCRFCLHTLSVARQLRSSANLSQQHRKISAGMSEVTKESSTKVLYSSVLLPESKRLGDFLISNLPWLPSDCTDCLPALIVSNAQCWSSFSVRLFGRSVWFQDWPGWAIIWTSLIRSALGCASNDYAGASVRSPSSLLTESCKFVSFGVSEFAAGSG